MTVVNYECSMCSVFQAGRNLLFDRKDGRRGKGEIPPRRRTNQYHTLATNAQFVSNRKPTKCNLFYDFRAKRCKTPFRLADVFDKLNHVYYLDEIRQFPLFTLLIISKNLPEKKVYHSFCFYRFLDAVPLPKRHCGNESKKKNETRKRDCAQARQYSMNVREQKQHDAVHRTCVHISWDFMPWQWHCSTPCMVKREKWIRSWSMKKKL